MTSPRRYFDFPKSSLWRSSALLFSFLLLAGFFPALARQSQTTTAASASTAVKLHPSTSRANSKSSGAVRKPVTTLRRVHRVVRHRAVAKRPAVTSKLHSSRTIYRRPARRVIHTRYVRRVRYYRPRISSTAGDVTEFDDPVVREAAIAALGPYYGSVVAVDPNDGRILSIVNQKLAFSSGFEPCSTIKPVIALAALRQGLINNETMIRVGRRYSIDLTDALAHSNNEFFAELGRRLGFPTVSYYAHLLGLGESAGWEMPEEHPGTFPAAPPPPSRGGIGKMTSFGEGIRITPLQLAAEMSAFANGGSLYYLQYPQTADQAKDFRPRLKRTIDLAPYAQDIRDGMRGAVEFGTARESYTPDGELVYAKTGTCTDETQGGELGWFVSYVSGDLAGNHPKLVLVVLLRRYGRRVSGPHAAMIGGRIYRQLYMQNFFSADNYNWNATAASDNR